MKRSIVAAVLAIAASSYSLQAHGVPSQKSKKKSVETYLNDAPFYGWYATRQRTEFCSQNNFSEKVVTAMSRKPDEWAKKIKKYLSKDVGCRAARELNEIFAACSRPDQQSGKDCREGLAKIMGLYNVLAEIERFDKSVHKNS